MENNQNLHIVSDVQKDEKKPFYDKAKRFFDIAMAVFLLIFCAPLLGLLFLLVLGSGNTPVIYRQERLGRLGKPFVMLKFRTMIENAEADGPKWAEKKDVRCTRIGGFLRHFHLDELPQLWNILCGDMSFVGPRPERAVFYAKFSENGLPDFATRLNVKPGLTGLAQINGGYDLSPAEKLHYDVIYIQNRSISMDIRCLLKTIPILLCGKGAR